MGSWGGERVKGYEQDHGGSREADTATLGRSKELTLTKAKSREGHVGARQEEFGLAGDLH